MYIGLYAILFMDTYLYLIHLHISFICKYTLQCMFALRITSLDCTFLLIPTYTFIELFCYITELTILSRIHISGYIMFLFWVFFAIYLFNSSFQKFLQNFVQCTCMIYAPSHQMDVTPEMVYQIVVNKLECKISQIFLAKLFKQKLAIFLKTFYVVKFCLYLRNNLFSFFLCFFFIFF